MFIMEMANLKIQIHHRYNYVRSLCRDYICSSDVTPDLCVSVTDEEIKHELSLAEFPVSEGYAEGICVYRNICHKLPSMFQAFLMHCAVIDYEGNGYAFAAQSGTGKSTHISFWQKRFGDGVRIINGDKPILRFCGDRLHAFGTPWCGKEGFNINDSVPLKAICFIERSEENRIRRISAKEAVTRIFHQVLTPSDLVTLDALFPLLDRMLREVPCYVLGCNMSVEAAEVAYYGMNETNFDEKEGSNT